MAKKFKLLGDTYTANDSKEETKLGRIDQILKNNPTDFDGTYFQGMKQLAGPQRKKVQAIINATKDLERKFNCKIKWSKMKWSLKITMKRYATNYRAGPGSNISGIGSNVVITGKCDNGKPVMYKYTQPSSAEGGARSYKVGNESGSNSDFTR